MEYKPDDRMDTSGFDPFAAPPEDLFEGLHLALELMRDNCMANVEIMADPRVGSGRCYVMHASPRLRDLLEVDGWEPLPEHEGIGLPKDLLFLQDPVDLPPPLPLMLAHFVARHYVDDLRMLFKRGDGVFFPRAVARQPDTWIRGESARSIVDSIIEDQYLWLGTKTPLIVAEWLFNRTRHELGRLNPKRVAAGRVELVAPSISTIRRRLGDLNERHGWTGGRNPGFVDGGKDMRIP